MTLTWLQSLIYGLISGFTEFLPVSAEGHRTLYLRLIGSSDSGALRLCVHLGALIALITLCTPLIAKINRERKIAAVIPKRRKREPDARTLMDLRVLKIAGIPVLLSMVLHPFVSGLVQHLWFLALFLFINGCILYFPQFYPRANKDSLTMSSSDAHVLGLGAALGFLPGISRVGAALAAGSVRGADRRYILDIILLLCLPALAILLIFDVFALFSGGFVFSFLALLCCITAALASFAGAYIGILAMRFFAVRVGFSGFAYYAWAIALLAFILFLTIS